MLKTTIIHILTPLDPGQQIEENRSKLDYWNQCNLIRNVLPQFSKIMRAVAIYLRFPAKTRISKAKRRKRVIRDMSTLKNSMLELAAKFDNYDTGLIKSFMFGLNKTEIKSMTDIISRYKFRDSHDHEYPFNFLRSYIHHKYINRLATSNSKSTTQQ
ncbi:hypothetical protein TNCV_4841051 [Trichonephila clavipes]|uniref:Uncharacterized protein n=1 Tax=Trichonephila clavipes TaxID=2585209 RepID=A0A8X6WK33_TRICX|nr:hypothetical protein TNCV_4841051 [Trichonephila clavipes]